MIKAILLTILIGLSYFFSSDSKQTGKEADKICGQWITAESKSVVEIFNVRGNLYYGKIISLKTPLENGKPKLDKNNPEASKKSQPLIGLLLLQGFKYDGKGQYSGGTIYDPDNGKTYSCKIKMTTNDQLDVRGYIGVSLIGRTTVWIRKK